MIDARDIIDTGDHKVAKVNWLAGKNYLARSPSARRIIDLLEASNNDIMVITKRDQNAVTRGSEWRRPPGYFPWQSKYKGGVLYWWLGERTHIVRGPKTGFQTSHIGLMHELFHAYQYIFQPATRAWRGEPQQWTKKWERFLKEIEIPTMEFESRVAKELGQPRRDDYVHYKCPERKIGQYCVLRTWPFPPKKDKYLCDTPKWDETVGKSTMPL